jgi:hypothetical protein
MSDDAVGQSICRAYSEWTGLRWNVFIHGFWTKSWREAQDAYWTSSGRPDVFSTGKSWSGKAQGWFFEFASFVWDLRNATEHGDDIHAQRQIWLAHCECTIRHLYARSSELPDGELILFESRCRAYSIDRSLLRNYGFKKQFPSYGWLSDKPQRGPKSNSAQSPNSLIPHSGLCRALT